MVSENSWWKTAYIDKNLVLVTTAPIFTKIYFFLPMIYSIKQLWMRTATKLKIVILTFNFNDYAFNFISCFITNKSTKILLYNLSFVSFVVVVYDLVDDVDDLVEDVHTLRVGEEALLAHARLVDAWDNLVTQRLCPEPTIIFLCNKIR